MAALGTRIRTPASATTTALFEDTEQGLSRIYVFPLARFYEKGALSSAFRGYILSILLNKFV